jgi:hypothetical protein
VLFRPIEVIVGLGARQTGFLLSLFLMSGGQP